MKSESFRYYFQSDKNLPSNVVSLQQYLPVYNPQLTYQQYLPQGDAGSQGAQANSEGLQQRSGPTLSSINPINDEPFDPKQVIANLKRNPEIPDVPPPALPVKTS